jgi:hypothetical protein
LAIHTGNLAHHYDPSFNSVRFTRDSEHILTDVLWSGQAEK